MNRKTIYIILAILVPIITLLYGAGDYLFLWDKLTGLQATRRALDRLYSPENFPTAFIYEGEKDFKPFVKLCLKYTTNREIIELKSRGVYPSLIGVLASKSRTSIPVPEGWPKAADVPEISPVLAGYGVKSPQIDTKPKRVGTLKDIRDWIDREKRRERFFISILLTSFLSIILALLGIEISKDKLD